MEMATRSGNNELNAVPLLTRHKTVEELGGFYST
jgi:hypothetical protein